MSPMRRLPDGSIQIYEEPGTLGLQVPTLSFEEIARIDEEVRQEQRAEEAAEEEIEEATEE